MGGVSSLVPNGLPESVKENPLMCHPPRWEICAQGGVASMKMKTTTSGLRRG